MTQNNFSEDTSSLPANHTRIARAIFSAAESMGISDRGRIEHIIDQVIERTEQRSLPGMENLIAESRNKIKYTPSVAEIQSMVKDILAKEDQEKQKEIQPKMTTMAKPKIKSNNTVISCKEGPVSNNGQGPKLSDNALHVLEKRYLKKDKTAKLSKPPSNCCGVWRRLLLLLT